MEDESLIEPQIVIEQAVPSKQLAAGRWLLSWSITNVGRDALQTFTVWLPHGQFRSPKQGIPSQPVILPEESLCLDLEVVCGEAPGSVVQNAFMILQIIWRSQPWRILARLRIAFDDAATPHSLTEVVTTQQVGFSQEL